MLKLRLIAAVILLLGVLCIFRLIRKRKLELKYGIPWLCAVLVAMIVDAFPGILFWITNLMGIETPSNALFLIALCLVVALIFILTVVTSRQSDRIKYLAQSIALCEEQIRELKAQRMQSSGEEKEEKI